ncbi:MAG: efflux RND transporter permease subunit, partial [Candidatus Thiodiazotropha sp. 6PLUC4]
DMPEGTALPVTANLAHRMAEKVRVMPEVTAVQVYAGTARPFDFNGMVRHYYLRSDPWQAEVQVQLLDKTERKRTSHEIAVQTREMLAKLTEGSGAKVAVVEMPPGPPVLQSVVAEVHGPSSEVRRKVAQDLTNIFSQTESLRDVDNYMRDPYQYWRFTVDTEKSVRRGISVDTINRNLGMALGGSPLGDVKQRAGHESVNIVMQVPMAERSEITRLGDLPIQSSTGVTIPLRELGRFEQVLEDPIIYHKDLRDVEYVVAEVGGKLAAPVYGMMQVQDLLDNEVYVAPDNVPIDAHWLGAPKNDTRTAIEWAGEWTVTFETFRDMGAAFAVALVLIYILVVWEFGNFRIPALIMAPIPLTLLGIIPAHFIFFQAGWGGEFTATSMIGWIALAGIIVRNSILLVDFSIHQVQQGVSVVDSVIMACKTRTRPIMITAFALVCGSSVIFFDPIFQGMAISLASGVMVSTVLTLIVIPLGCITASKDILEVAAATAPEGSKLLTQESDSSPQEIESEPVAAVEKPESEGDQKRSLGMVVWAKIVALFTMIFYLFKGIFLLLGQLFKGLRKKGKESTPTAEKPDSAGGGSSGSDPDTGGFVPDSGTPTSGATEPPIAAAPATEEKQPAVAAEASTQSDALLEETKLSETSQTSSVAEAEGSEKEPKQSAEGSQAAAGEAAAKKPQARQEKAAQKPEAVPAKPKKRPSTLKKQVSKKKAAVTAKKGNGESKAQSSTTEPRKKAVSNVANFPLRKKAARRGIRLK